MGQRLLIILAFLLLVRPIVWTDNPACGEAETTAEQAIQAVPPLVPTKEVPCSDIAHTQEVVENNHHCPCPAMMRPELASIAVGTNSKTLFAMSVHAVETAVATPPTPPPRLV